MVGSGAQLVAGPAYHVRWALGLLALAWCIGCSDVGDSSAVPGDEASEGEAAVSDTSAPEQEGGDATMSAPSSADASDATMVGQQSEPPDGAESPDTEMTGLSIDAPAVSPEGSNSPPEAGPGDAPSDSPMPDAQSDAYANDAGGDGATDAQAADAAADSGADGQADGAAPDAAIDASGPSPCTTSPCAVSGPNSVKCDGNTGMNEPAGVCSPTEAFLVSRDIAKKNLTAAGQLTPYVPLTKTGSCYECMVYNDCIDDDTNGDTGKECGDVTKAALDGEPGPQECLDTLECMQTSMCDTADPPAACFCGTASGADCLTAGAANGPCLNLEIDGIGVGTCSTTYPAAKSCTEGDPIASAKAYADVTWPAGNANALLGCAYSNCKAACTP
jgi:hypothetical protein